MGIWWVHWQPSRWDALISHPFVADLNSCCWQYLLHPGDQPWRGAVSTAWHSGLRRLYLWQEILLACQSDLQIRHCQLWKVLGSKYWWRSLTLFLLQPERDSQLHGELISDSVKTNRHRGKKGSAQHQILIARQMSRWKKSSSAQQDLPERWWLMWMQVSKVILASLPNSLQISKGIPDMPMYEWLKYFCSEPKASTPSCTELWSLLL